MKIGSIVRSSKNGEYFNMGIVREIKTIEYPFGNYKLCLVELEDGLKTWINKRYLTEYTGGKNARPRT